MKPQVTLIVLIGVASALCEWVQASTMILRVLPDNLVGTSISARVEDQDFGKHFTVIHQTNEYTRDEFLHGRLEINDADEQISSCEVEKRWTTNGVEFSFTVAPDRLEASKFTLLEFSHSGNRPMPGCDAYWFYLRDFVINSAAPTRSSSNVVSPKILKELSRRIGTLKPGITADETWEQLVLAAYHRRLGGTSYPTHDRFWLNWNHELELSFEPPKAEAKWFPDDNRKLIRATLFKSGRAIASSR